MFHIWLPDSLRGQQFGDDEYCARFYRVVCRANARHKECRSILASISSRHATERRREQHLPYRRQVLHPAVVDDGHRQHTLAAHPESADDLIVDGGRRRRRQQKPAEHRGVGRIAVVVRVGLESTTSSALENVLDPYA
jgi:hypothetical protein